MTVVKQSDWIVAMSVAKETSCCSGSPDGRSLEDVSRVSGVGRPFLHTMYHVLYSLCVIFAEVDDSSLRFSESVATGSLEEGRSGSEQYTMYWVSFSSTDNGQI
jgi:hypothetical protein